MNTPAIALLVITDGRDEIHAEAEKSAEQMLPHCSAGVVQVEDRDHELGFSGAIAEGWRRLPLECPAAEYVFHLEGDFTFRAPVALTAMAELLRRQPHLAQVALKRQPVNREEKTAGGIVERAPENFRQRHEAGIIWTEHRVCFTTNPCLYPARLTNHGWPQERESEGVFTHMLLEDPDTTFAFWGPKTSPPLVDHIGDVRAGGGY